MREKSSLALRFGERALKRLFIALAILLPLISVFSHLPSVFGSSGINEQINFQGRLMDSSGGIVPDGNYNVEFNIYQDGDGCVPGGSVSSPCGGTLKWTEDWLNNSSQGVQVKNGYFSVMLGSHNAFASNIDWNQSVLWLSINIAGTAPSCTPFSSCSPDGEMLPFIRFASTPYALNAKYLGGLQASGFVQLGPGAVQTDSTANASIFINKNNAAGNIFELQKASSDVFTIANGGNITATGTYNTNTFTGSALTFGTAGTATIQSASSQILTITSHGTSTWSTDNGSLTLQASGTNTATLDTAGAGSVTLATNATTINIGSVGSSTTADTIHIADSTGAATQIITVGSLKSASSLTLQAGTAGISIQTGQVSGGTSGSITIQSGAGSGVSGGTAGDVSIDTGGTSNSGSPAVNVGTTNARTISIGRTGSGTITTNIQGGTTINIGTANAANTIQIGDTADAVAQIISIGNNTTSGSANTVTLGSLKNTSATSIQAASGGISITTGSTAGTGSITIQTGNVAVAGAAGNVSIDTGTTASGTPTVSIGTTNAKAVTIGRTSGALTYTGSSSSTFVLNGTTVDTTEFNFLDGHDAALVDINDAVNTAITGTGALDAGSITSNFGAINVGTDNIQGGAATFTAATSLTLGTASSNNASILFKSSGGANTVTLAAPTTNPGASYTLNLPINGPSTSQCLQSDPSTATQLIFNSCAAGGGDNVSVNGSGATDANFIDTSASGTVTGTAFALNTTPSPDQITITISNASASQAGSITTGAQTIAGDKSLTGNTSIGSTGSASAASTTHIGDTTDNTNSQIVQIGSTAKTTDTVTLQGGGAASTIVLQTAASGGIDIGVNNVASKAINIGSVGATAQDTTIHFADSSAGIQTITVGSTNSTSATTVQGGTGATAISLTQGSGGTIVIGGTTGAAAVTVQCGTGTCGFGTNGTDHSTTVGSTNGTSVTTIQSGSGNIILQANGTGNTANIQVGAGNGGAGSATPDLLVLDGSNSSTDPTEVDGAMYYNVATHSFRCGRNGFWSDCATNEVDHSYDFTDDFLAGAAAGAGAAALGDIGWISRGTCTADTYNPTGTVTLNHDHPGVAQIKSGATSGNICNYGEATNNTIVLAAGDVIKTSAAIEGTLNNVIYRTGWTNQGTTASTRPTSGAWWEADNTTDTHWEYCYGDASNPHCTDNTAATPSIAANTWVKLEIRIISTSAIDFLYNGTKVSLTGLTLDLGGTNKLSPQMDCGNRTAAAQTCDVDYLQWRGVITTAGGR